MIIYLFNFTRIQVVGGDIIILCVLILEMQLGELFCLTNYFEQDILISQQLFLAELYFYQHTGN